MDTGAACLALLLRLKGVATDPNAIRRSAGSPATLTKGDIAAVAGSYGFRVRCLNVAPRKRAKALHALPLPVILEMNDGEFAIVAERKGDGYLCRHPRESKPRAIEANELLAMWSGSAILLGSRKGERGDIPFGFGWFIPLIAERPGLVTQIVASTVFIQLFALVTPMFTMLIIDKVLSTGGIRTLDVLFFGLVVVAVFDFLLGTTRKIVMTHLTGRIDAALVADLFRKVSHLPLAFFASRKTGDTVARVKEVESIRQFLTGPALTALVDLPFTLIFIVVMLFFSPMLTAIAGAAMGILMLLYGVVAGSLKKRLQDQYSSRADQQSFLTEAVSSIETIKTLAVEPQLQRSWEESVVAQGELSRRTESLTNGISQFAGFINKLTVGLCLWVGAGAVIDGTLSAGQLIAFNMMVGRLMGPAMRIAQLFQQLHQTRASIGRVSDLMNAQAEPSMGTAPKALPSIKGRVEFENVTFRYAPDGPAVLEDVSLRIEPGEVIGIVGSSGSGKTTFVRLIQRLFTPEKGSILIDGVNIGQIDPAWLRRQMGIVLQDSVLLNRTIRENIALADPTLSQKAVEAAARIAGADTFIRKLPHAYDTVVGERGQSLSTGQRQRIALARALALNPRLLILDEATSALDYESEKLIQSHMADICKGRTVIIVAHRLSTVRIADRIVTIEGGRIVEQGKPEDLLKSGGRYATLHALQAGAE